jgi:hypothetical protein
MLQGQQGPSNQHAVIIRQQLHHQWQSSVMPFSVRPATADLVKYKLPPEAVLGAHIFLGCNGLVIERVKMSLMTSLVMSLTSLINQLTSGVCCAHTALGTIPWDGIMFAGAVRCSLEQLQAAAGSCRTRHWLMRVLKARPGRLQLQAAFAAASTAMQELTAAVTIAITVSGLQQQWQSSSPHFVMFSWAKLSDCYRYFCCGCSLVVCNTF